MNMKKKRMNLQWHLQMFLVQTQPVWH